MGCFNSRAVAVMVRAAPLPNRERRHLFYFNGVLGYKPMGGGDLANYSFGLRQQLYALYGNAGSEVVVTDVKTPKYDEELSTSTFCGVLPGWGWSGRMEDAVLHGCIPVILQDGVHTPWESVLDTPSYALRVKREEMPRLIEILRSVPQGRIAKMQAALRTAWPRFSYLSVAASEHARRGRPMPKAVEAAAGRRGRDPHAGAPRACAAAAGAEAGGRAEERPQAGRGVRARRERARRRRQPVEGGRRRRAAVQKGGSSMAGRSEAQIFP